MELIIHKITTTNTIYNGTLKTYKILIKFVAKSGANEVKLEMEDVKITIKTGSKEISKLIVQALPLQPAIQ